MTSRYALLRERRHGEPLLFAYLLSAPLFFGACTESPSEVTDLELSIAGVAQSEASLPDGTKVTFTEAKIAFGPLTLCPGDQAGALCPTARLEWLSSRVVDLTKPEVVKLGTLSGQTGEIRSYMFDLGSSSLLTAEAPYVFEATDDLDGDSVHLRFTAQVDQITIPVVVKLPIFTTEASERGQPLIRKSQSERFELVVDGSQSTLKLTWDPSTWIHEVETRDFYVEGGCAEQAQGTECDGLFFMNCETGDRTDCGQSGQFCAPSVGCVDEVELPPASLSVSLIRQAILAGVRPSFELR